MAMMYRCTLLRNITNYGNLALVFSTKGEAEKAIEILEEGLAQEPLIAIVQIGSFSKLSSSQVLIWFGEEV